MTLHFAPSTTIDDELIDADAISPVASSLTPHNTPSPHASADDLRRSLFGGAGPLFDATEWPERPVLIRVDRDPLEDLGLDDVERLLTTGAAASDIRLLRSADGEVFEEPCPTQGAADRVDGLAVLRHYGEGWTINANSVHRVDGRLSSLAVAFADLFDVSVNINLYVTPPGAQGFQPHVDGHDVFILPIAGEKVWEISDRPIELPLERQRTPPAPDGAENERMVVAPGTALFVPRGWRHRAWSETAGCAHLTVGLHPIRAVELVNALVRAVAERDVRLRVGVPKSEALEVSRDRLVQLATSVADFADSIADDVVADVQRAVRAKVLRNGAFAAGSTLTAIDHLDEINMSTVLRHRNGQDHLIETTDDDVSLLVGNTSITMPGWVESALAFVAEHDEFDVSELPDISATSALVLARRLVRDGVLEFDPTNPTDRNNR